MPRGELDERLYAQFARVAQALASERRLELLDLLAQAPRRVDALTAETGMTLTNVSQHLQILKNARLVDSKKCGSGVTYRLATPTVTPLLLALRSLAAEQLPEIDRLRAASFSGVTRIVSRDDLQDLLQSGTAVLVDVRPSVEYAHGHISGAISIPLDDFGARLGELPQGKAVVTYCRGAFCSLAGQAVAVLQNRGIDAARLDGGWPEWVAEGRPVIE